MKIGFIGLGRMGSAMAANLIKAGHDVTVFNRNPEKSRSLLGLGAHQATSVAGACQGEAVLTMLADDTAVSDVALTDGGIVGKLRQGAIHISMSTISVGLSKELALAHAKAGQRFVAAPVFGRPDAAAAAKLFIVNAGDPVAVAACQPLFAAMGQKPSWISWHPASSLHRRMQITAAQSRATSFNRRVSPHRWASKISASYWRRPNLYARPCRSPAFCATGFSACSLKAVMSSIGRRSAAWPLRTQAKVDRRPSLASLTGSRLTLQSKSPWACRLRWSL